MLKNGLQHQQIYISEPTRSFTMSFNVADYKTVQSIKLESFKKENIVRVLPKLIRRQDGDNEA